MLMSLAIHPNLRSPFVQNTAPITTVTNQSNTDNSLMVITEQATNIQT